MQCDSMTKTTLLAALLATASLLASPASAGYAVPSGCSAPSTTFIHEWYVDPVRGSDLGDGSQARPWRTLQEVFAAGLVGFQGYTLPYAPDKALNPAPASSVVHPGDAIWLASGDHGSIILKNAYNSNFITIKALPGATPTLTRFSIIGGSHWVLDGVTVESVNTNPAGTGNTLINIASNAFWGALNNIVVNGNTVKSQEDTTAWTPADWRAKASNGIILNAGMPLADGAKDLNGVNDGTCFSITNNAISNVAFGVVFTLADKVLVARNNVDRFADDAFDYNVSDALVDGNKITNAIDSGDGIHRDGMQGQPYWGESTYNHDLTFSNNIVIAQTDPNLKYAACLQGIDTFNGRWKNIAAYNNLVIANTYNGLVFAGVENLSIHNNTVLSSGDPHTCFTQPEAPAQNVPESAGPTTDATNAKGFLWIGVLNGIPGNPSTNVVIRNNIASLYNIAAKTSTTFDHNIVSGTNAHLRIAMPPGGVPPAIISAEALFVNFHPATYSYDVRLRTNSPAIGAGLSEGAPTVDLFGTARGNSVDNGAVAAATRDRAVLGRILGATPTSPPK